ncbi:MAG: GntR family transcriptional regulator [Treponema sp.]|jgi:GntR family transcriptional regulator|nr:GntR family transcriptional regulator [Treponema sp.]
MNSTNTAEGISFTLDETSGAPVYRQIIRQIENGVLSGRLKTGDRLPTIRSLAVDLKINPNTIAKAYGELEIRGILATRAGSGTYIADKRPEPEEDMLEAKIREALGRFMREMRDLGADKGEILRLIRAWEDGQGKWSKG